MYRLLVTLVALSAVAHGLKAASPMPSSPSPTPVLHLSDGSPLYAIAPSDRSEAQHCQEHSMEPMPHLHHHEVTSKSTSGSKVLPTGGIHYLDEIGCEACKLDVRGVLGWYGGGGGGGGGIGGMVGTYCEGAFFMQAMRPPCNDMGGAGGGAADFCGAIRGNAGAIGGLIVDQGIRDELEICRQISMCPTYMGWQDWESYTEFTRDMPNPSPPPPPPAALDTDPAPLEPEAVNPKCSCWYRAAGAAAHACCDQKEEDAEANEEKCLGVCPPSHAEKVRKRAHQLDNCMLPTCRDPPQLARLRAARQRVKQHDQAEASEHCGSSARRNHPYVGNWIPGN